MAATRPVTADSQLTLVQECLNEIRVFPCISSTHVALHLTHFFGEFQTSASPHLAPREIVPIATQVTGKGVFKAAGLAIITYLALNSLAMLSVMINGAVGAGKIGLAFLVTLSDYQAAQNLLEEGSFHLLVAASDFALSYFTFVSAGIALASAIVPDAAKTYFATIYRPWSGAIQHAPDATEAVMAEERGNFCYLQRVSDAVQCIVMPNDGMGRLESAWAALQARPESQ